MVWQGGFMFYGGVVVPVGARILGSETQQGFITQAVTHYLNLAGAVTLGIWFEHLWHDRLRGVTRNAWLLWSLMAGLQIVLVIVHWQMDLVLSMESTSILDPVWFGRFHKIYIGSSSVQWFAALVLLLLTLRRWDQR
jgi:hypothetical protein